MDIQLLSAIDVNISSQNMLSDKPVVKPIYHKKTSLLNITSVALSLLHTPF